MFPENPNPQLNQFTEILEIKRGQNAKKLSNVYVKLSRFTPKHHCWPWCACRKLYPLQNRLLAQQQQIASAEADLISGDPTSTIRLAQNALIATRQKIQPIDHLLIKIVASRLGPHYRRSRSIQNLPLLIADLIKYSQPK